MLEGGGKCCVNHYNPSVVICYICQSFSLYPSLPSVYCYRCYRNDIQFYANYCWLSKEQISQKHRSYPSFVMNSVILYSTIHTPPSCLPACACTAANVFVGCVVVLCMQCNRGYE